MASYALSIKPYANTAKARAMASATWFARFRRRSARAGAQFQQWSRRLSPWYDESEHGNRLVMWS